MENTEITVAQDFLREPTALGEVFSKSNFFPDVKTAAQAIVKILCGKELGLSPFQSMASIFIVNGKLALTSSAMAALIKRSKKYNYVVSKLTDEICEIDFFDISDKDDIKKLGTSTFGKVEAAKAGLINRETYKAYPKNMFFARALSNGAKFYCADAISGFYEVSELVDAGEIIEAPKTMVTLNQDGEVTNEAESKKE